MVRREHQALLNEPIHIALARYAVGTAAQQESLKAQVELSTLHASLLTLEQEQQSLRIALNAFTGHPDDPLFFGTAQIDYRPLEVAVGALEAQSLEQRPEIRAGERMVAGGKPRRWPGAVARSWRRSRTGRTTAESLDARG
jgi:outer membrane protein TolC